jgi:UDP-N-acetyl-D-mannosaminuronate dehydrogenase
VDPLIQGSSDIEPGWDSVRLEVGIDTILDSGGATMKRMTGLGAVALTLSIALASVASAQTPQQVQQKEMEGTKSNIAAVHEQELHNRLMQNQAEQKQLQAALQQKQADQRQLQAVPDQASVKDKLLQNQEEQKQVQAALEQKQKEQLQLTSDLEKVKAAK